jgi:hypothetical protein
VYSTGENPIPVKTISEKTWTNKKIDYLEILKKDKELAEKEEIISTLTQKVLYIV